MDSLSSGKGSRIKVRDTDFQVRDAPELTDELLAYATPRELSRLRSAEDQLGSGRYRRRLAQRLIERATAARE